MSEVNSRVVKIPNLQKWENQSLEQLCFHVRRGTAPHYVEQSSVKAIGQRCVSKQGFDSSFARPHSERALDGTLQAIEGDVLLNSTGTGTIGRSVVFRESGTFIVDGHVTALRPKVSKCSSTWLSAVLQSPWGQEHLERFCYSGSTNQVELSASALRVSAVPAPSYDEQSKIAEVLDTLDAAIRGTEAVVAKLKAMKQGLLHDLLTRGIDANGDLRPPKPEAPQLYKQTPLGWLPKEWDVAELGTITSLVTSGSRGWARFYSDDGHLFVRSQNVRMGTLDLTERQHVRVAASAEGARTALAASDFLVTITGNGVGNACVVPDKWDETAFVSQHVGLVRFFDKSLGGYAGRFFIAGGPGNHQILDAQYGQSKPGLSLTNLRELRMGIPPVSERTNLMKILAEADEKIADENALLDKLRLQKFGLMDDLLTGRRPVTALL